MIKSHLLYQLSYAPGTGPESLRKRASFSKATPRCPANRRGFPGPSARAGNAKKPPESGGFSWISTDRRAARLEPLGAAAAAMIPVRRHPDRHRDPDRRRIHAALEAAMPPAFAAEPAFHDGSGWRGGASGRRRGSCRAGRPRPRSSSAPPPRSPCCRRARAGAPPDRPASAASCVILLRLHPRIGAIDPQLGEIPHRGLDRRPQLFLVGVELQPGVDGGDPRVGKGRPVLGVCMCACARETTDDAGHRPRSNRRWRARRRRRWQTSSCEPPLKVAQG